MKAPPKPQGVKSELGRLKDLPAEQREAIWEWRAETDDKGVIISNAIIRHRIAAQFGIRLFGDYQLSRFWKYQFHQMRAENWNERQEQFQKFFLEQNPNASRDQVRQAAIAFFMSEAASEGDRDGFVEMATLDLADQRGKTKVELEKQKLALQERRVLLLEKKAAQAEATEKVLSNAQLTAEQREQRIKEIYGRA